MWTFTKRKKLFLIQFWSKFVTFSILMRTWLPRIITMKFILMRTFFSLSRSFSDFLYSVTNATTLSFFFAIFSNELFPSSNYYYSSNESIVSAIIFFSSFKLKLWSYYVIIHGLFSFFGIRMNIAVGCWWSSSIIIYKQ